MLDAHFPATLHDDVLAAVGLSLEVARASRRDPGFRQRVLLAYEHRCAMCGFDARLDGHSIGLEAAHVRWHAAKGPDRVDNGLALCVLHHKALDRGFLTVDPDYRVRVSMRLTGGEEVARTLTDLHGSPLLGPQPGQPRVLERHLTWHQAQVFRGPERGEVVAY